MAMSNIKDALLRKCIVAIKDTCSDFQDDLDKYYTQNRGKLKKQIFTLIQMYEATIKKQEAA